MKKIFCVLILIATSSIKAQLGLTPPSPIFVCETSTPPDGFELFDLTIRESEIIQPTENYIFTYHPTSGDALSGINAFQNPNAYTNTSNPQLIFIRVRLIGSNDNEITTMEIGVVAQPVPENLPTDIIINDGDGDGLAIFDLTVNETAMIGSQNPSDFEFAYFISEIDCLASTNQIPSPTMFQNFENPQSIYAQMRSLNTDCFACLSFNIEADGELSIEEFNTQSIIITPNPASDYVEITTRQETTIKLFSVNGLLLSYNEKSLNTKLSISNLNAGMYFLEITEGQNRIVKKLIKK